MLHFSYKSALTFGNIVNSFVACGLWSVKTNGVDLGVLRSSDITELEGRATHVESHTDFMSLVQSLRSATKLLRSDGGVMTSGVVNTTSGVLLTSSDVMSALREHEDCHAAEDRARAHRAADKDEFEHLVQNHSQRERLLK